MNSIESPWYYHTSRWKPQDIKEQVYDTLLEMRQQFFHDWKRDTVSQAQLEAIMQDLDSTLGQLCDKITHPKLL